MVEVKQICKTTPDFPAGSVCTVGEHGSPFLVLGGRPLGFSFRQAQLGDLSEGQKLPESSLLYLSNVCGSDDREGLSVSETCGEKYVVRSMSRAFPGLCMEKINEIQLCCLCQGSPRPPPGSVI